MVFNAFNNISVISAVFYALNAGAVVVVVVG
jgi:hypothetical protein